jgi:hypothetical protein
MFAMGLIVFAHADRIGLTRNAIIFGAVATIIAVDLVHMFR